MRITCREPSRIPIRTMERLKNKSRKFEMVYLRKYSLTASKSSKLYCYVKARKQENKAILHLNALRNLINL